MKKHNTSKVVLITMLLFLLLTWILPAAYYSGEYVDQGRVQMGLFDLFNYPLTALSYFGYIAFYLILVGGFYGILYKIPAYRSFLDKIVEKAKGTEKFVIALMILVNAFLVSFCGLQIGIAILVPFEVSLILLMGYDKITSAFVVVGSISAGLIGTTYAYNNLSALLQTLNLKLGYQIGVRFILLLLASILVIFNTLMYMKNNVSDVKIERKSIKKPVIDDEDEDEEEEEDDDEEDDEVIAEKVKEPVKKTSSTSKKTTNSKSQSTKSGKSTNKSSSKTGKQQKKSSKARKSVNKAALKDEDIIVVKESMDSDAYLIPNKSKKDYKTGLFAFILFLLFVILVLSFITWGDNGFKVTVFDNSTKAVQDFKLFGFPLFGKILGTVNSFGNWTINDFCLPMLLVAFLLAFINKVKFEDVVEGFVGGAKKALEPATIVILVYSLLVLVTYHPFQLVIYKAILGMTKGFNIASTVIVAILSSLFNADIAYSFQSVLPYYVSIVTKSNNYSLVAVIFQSMYGMTMLVAPTSIFLLATLSYLNVSYKDWLKNVWKLLLELFILLLIVFIILAVM